MLRFVGFLVLVLVLRAVLHFVPGIGPLLDHLGIFGLWALVLGLSWFFSKWTERAMRIRRDASKVRALAAVDSPHNQGKLGSLLLAQGRARRSLAPLRAAAQGEPRVAEWHYRVGLALLALREHDEAAEALERCVALDEEYAYGAAMLRLAEAELGRGRAERALEVLARFERNHGPNPESAYRRGRTLRKLGRKDAARSAFGEVKVLAGSALGYQRRQAALWSLRATLARLG